MGIPGCISLDDKVIYHNTTLQNYPKSESTLQAWNCRTFFKPSIDSLKLWSLGKQNQEFNVLFSLFLFGFHHILEPKIRQISLIKD